MDLNTRSFKIGTPQKEEVKKILKNIDSSLEEKGYNSINQIVGYLISGDPAYIPRHNNARTLIRQMDRDKIIEELVKSYIEKED